MAHDWPGKKIRGFPFAAFGLTIPVQLALLFYTFGFVVLWNVALGIACFPLVYAGNHIRLRIGNAINTDELKIIAYGMLLATGLGAVVPAFL